MIKTSALTKTLFNHQNQSQIINLYTPSTTPSSGSIGEADPSSLSSSYKSNNDAQINEDIHSLSATEPTASLINLIDKLKRELATVKQAKCQLATLYKVKCKSDLDKAARITKLRLQYEYELNAFCKQDQKDLVSYLQRQLNTRDQRIAELSYDIEKLRNVSLTNSITDKQIITNTKTVPIQLLRTNNPDLTNSTNSHSSDEHERILEKHNAELQERIKRFERQFEVVKQDQPKDHNKELIKRALAKQATKDALQYQKLLNKKNEEIDELNLRLQQASKSILLETALRQANVEKLHLERRLLAATAASSSLNFIKNTKPSNPNPSTSINEQQSYTTASIRSRADSSTTSSIDPFHYQALQDTNEALKSEVHRLTRTADENIIQMNLQLEQYNKLQEAYQLLQNDYAQLTDVVERFNELEKKYQHDKSSFEYCSRENEQLKDQSEHLLNELTRLTQIENRDRTRTIEQNDLRRQYEELIIQYNQLNQQFKELKENYQENQNGYENDIKHFNDEIIRYRLENEQLQSANDLLRDERNQMKDSHETILKKRLDEIKYLQIENRDLQAIRQKYNEERDTFQAIDLRRTQLENDLLTMQAVEDRCQDLQTTVERLQTEIQLSQKKSDDHTMALTNLNKENARLIKELESASMLNTQMRTEISNATNTNERLIEENERYRSNFLIKSDECDMKRRENEQLHQKIIELESTIKSLRDSHDLQKQLNVENEVNKLELKKKQADFEQFQVMHDVTKRENQETIHLLQEKIHDLERKTELQSLKHEEILLEFESLKARRDRILPSSVGTMLTNNQLSPLSSSPHHWPLPTMVDSQTSPTDESTSFPPPPPPLPLPTPPPPPVIPPPPPPVAITQYRAILKSTGIQSINPNEIQDIKQKSFINNPTAQIVQAKYSYEPLQFSPNDHPEVELPLNVGEYYLIYGDVDEDGFYDGRNLDGRYGLIPSNFIEPVTNPHELSEPIRHIIQRLTGKSLTEETTSTRRDLTSSIDSDVFSSNTSINISGNYRKQLTTNQNGNPIDVSSTNGLSFGKHVSCPINLRVEKYLSNSVLIAWNSPSTNLQILGYQVLLDHSLYTTIRANERTRALIENINMNEKLHRLSIRTISQRGLSRDQECTLLLTMSANNGNLNDLSYAPSDLRVDRINQTSAVVSWWPASNEIVHKLFVNDIEVQTLKAGVYRFKLSGLLPNTTHKVTIKAKPNNVTNIQQQQLATSIEFRTTSFDEFIEPLQRVQVIAGPQSNTLLISWEQPLSMGTVRGYRVLVDGRLIQDVTNPINDHTVINMNSVRHGRLLTVRILTENDGESHDSIPIDLEEILKKLDMDNSSTIIPVIAEEIYDKESMPLTASSSLTLRTTSDDETTNIEQASLPPMEYQIKPPLPQETPSTTMTNIPSTRQPSNISSQTPSSSIKPTPIAHPDKIRPITKSSPRTVGIAPIQSPSRTSSTASSINTDVPQIEINSPSPNNSVTTSKTTMKLKTENRDPNESRFGYDTYMKPSEELIPSTKSSSPRKSSKPSTTISPIKTRDHVDPRRTTATPINGNPMMNKNRMSSPRHPSTSSEEQHIVSPIPMKPIKIKDQIAPPPSTPIVNNPIINKNNVPPRLFIALFDYDPNAMSPNKDNEEELPFKEGQLIRIYGDQDADGFYIGQTEDGRQGFVPSNMVSEIQLDDAEIEAHLFAGTLNLENPTRLPSTTTTTTSNTSTTTPTSTGKRVSGLNNPPNVKSSTISIKKMIAMFDYNPKEQSPNPNSDDELSFHSGDIIYVHGNVQDDGFYIGELENGRKGLVPSNFLKEVSSITTEENLLHQDNEQIISNDNKKTSYRR